MDVLVGCDEGVHFAVDRPDGFEVIVAGAGAGGRIAAGVEAIGDVEGNCFADGFCFAAGETPVAILFDDQGLYDEGFEGVAVAVGAPNYDVVICTIGVSAGCCDDYAVVVGKHALFGHAPGAGSAVGKLDREVAGRDGVGDRAEGSEVLEQAARDIGEFVGAIDDNGLLIADAGDVEVVDPECHDGAFVLPVGTDWDRDSDNAGAGAMTCAAEDVVSDIQLTKAVSLFLC